MTRFSYGPLLALVCAVSLTTACSDDEGTTPATDSGADGATDSTIDSSTDSGSIDTGGDDTAIVDSGSDTGAKDTGVGDSGGDADVGVGGDVPEAYFGVWAGNGFSYPSFTYPMIHVLTPGLKGEVIGWSSYPTYPCGGRLKLDNVTGSTAGDAGPADAVTIGETGAPTLPNGVQVTEILEYGKDLCGDGAKQSFALRSDGKVNWAWMSSSYFDTGTLTRIGDPGADVPKAFWGVWRGTWNETGGSDAGTTDAGDTGVSALKTDKLFAAITLGKKDFTVAAFVYEDSKCTGRWNLTASTATSLTLTENVLNGTCENGTVTLTTSGANLAYSWTKGARTLTGTLTRVTP